MEKRLFFSEVYTIYIDGFLVIAISTYLTITNWNFTPFGETISFTLAIFSLTVILILTPYSFFKILRADEFFLDENEQFK